MVVKLNTVRLNCASLNHASLNGVGERLRASAGEGGGEVIPPDVPVTYILSASASNGVVSASVNGNAVTLPYTANEGDVVVVEVTANDGYEFEGWSDGNTDNPRSITMTADVTLSATCVEQVVESKYIQFADPAVEAVLMANNVSSDGVGITKEDAAAVTSIGTWFKGNTDITSFDEFEYFTGVTFLGTHLTSAGYGAFTDCTNLEYLTLPPSCIDLRVQALANCTSLKRVNGFEYVKTIRNRMATNSLLSQDLNLASVEGEIGYAAFAYTSIKNILSLGQCTKLGDTNSSGSGVFDKCKSLRSVDIPESLTYIGGCAFMDDDALESVTGIEGVTTIRQRAFSGCTSLEYDSLDFNELVELGQDALNGVKVKRLNLETLPTLPYAAPSRPTYGDRNTLEEVILSDSVSVIPAYSFINYVNLTSIVMNKSVITSIEAVAFRGIPISGEMDFPSLVSLGENSFRETDITSFVARNVSDIKSDAFRSCDKLKIVEIGAVSEIGSTAFYGCSALESFIVRSVTPPTLNSSAFNSTNSTFLIYVPDASVEAYKTATNWSQYADRIHPLSELEGVVIEDGYELNSNGTLKESANYFVVGFIDINGGESITWGMSSGAIGYLVEYDESGNYKDYWRGDSTNKRTITTKSSSKKIKACFQLAYKNTSYIYDETNGKYLWKGANVE